MTAGQILMPSTWANDQIVVSHGKRSRNRLVSFWWPNAARRNRIVLLRRMTLCLLPSCAPILARTTYHVHAMCVCIYIASGFFFVRCELRSVLRQLANSIQEKVRICVNKHRSGRKVTYEVSDRPRYVSFISKLHSMTLKQHMFEYFGASRTAEKSSNRCTDSHMLIAYFIKSN